MKVYNLEYRDYEGSSTLGIYENLNEAISKLREYYITTGTKLDIVPFETNMFNPDSYDNLIFYGRKYINKHVEKKRNDFLDAEHDDYIRKYGFRNNDDDFEDISNMIGSGVAIGVFATVLSIVSGITERTEFENKVLRGIEGLK